MKQIFQGLTMEQIESLVERGDITMYQAADEYERNGYWSKYDAEMSKLEYARFTGLITYTEFVNESKLLMALKEVSI